MSKKKNDFEFSLSKIVEIANKLENEEMNLEEAMTLYKEAMSLINGCQSQVEEAEREIYIYRETLKTTKDENESEASIIENSDENINNKSKKTRKKVKSSKTDEEHVFELFSDIKIPSDNK